MRWTLNLGFHFTKEFFSEQWAKISSYHIIFLIVIKSSKLFNPLGCVSKTHNHQWEICISNQKPPYIPMEPYLQQYCQRHIQEYISWNRNQHKLWKSTTGMMLLSLLRVQDNNILPKWYEETTGLCLLMCMQRWLHERVAKELYQSCKQISRYLNHHPN